jgi:hypothetical protein
MPTHPGAQLAWRCRRYVVEMLQDEAIPRGHDQMATRPQCRARFPTNAR